MMMMNMFRTLLSFHPCLFCLKPQQILKEFRMSLLTLSLFRLLLDLMLFLLTKL